MRNAIIALFVLLCHIVFAQNQSLNFRKLTVDDGLANSSAYCVVQDAYGYIWIGTEDGLSRYDGSKCQNFYYNQEDSTTIPNNQIKTLYLDKRNDLWLGTSRGFAKYNRNYDNFDRYYLNYEDSVKKIKANQSNIVFTFFEDKNGIFYISTHCGVFVFDRKSTKFEYLELKKSIGIVFSINEEFNGDLLLGCDSGLVIYNRTKREIYKLLNSNNTKNFANSNITKLFRNSNNKIFIGTKKGLFGLKKNYTIDTTVFNALGFKNNFQITGIIEDENNCIWASTTMGILRIDSTNKKTEVHLRDYNNPQGLIERVVFDVCIDNGKLIWIATLKGVNIYDKQFQNFRTIRRSNIQKQLMELGDLFDKKKAQKNNKLNEFLPINKIYPGVITLIESKSKNMYIGNVFGLFHWDCEFGIYTPIALPPNGSEKTSVNLLYLDHLGRIFVMINNQYLYLMNDTSKTFKLVAKIANDNKNVINLFVDRNENIWISLENSNTSLIRINKNFSIVKNLKGVNYKDSIQICLHGSIIQDKSGTIWMSSRGKGLVNYDLQKDKFTYINPDSINGKKADISMINRVFIDSKNRLWLCTKESGLVLYNPQINTYEVYAVNKGMPSNNILSCIEDNYGELWLISLQGLIKFNPETKNIRSYNTLDGLGNITYRGNTIGKTSDGRLFAWGYEAIDIWNPSEIKPNRFAPIVDIKELQVNYKLVIPGKNSILKKHISLTDTFELSYSENIFAFEFIALHYSNPIKNLYAYKLEGFDKDWIYQDFKRRFASYSNLKAGTYIFKVKAANADGFWNTKEKQIVIIVHPPFWETWWFRFLAVIVIFGSLYLTIRLRVRKIEKQKRAVEEQNALISNKNDEIQKQAEILSQTNEELELKNEIVSKTLSNLKVLSDFGQKITATLSIKEINEMIYDYVCTLMPTDAFGIGLYNERTKTIVFSNFKEYQTSVPSFFNSMNQENSLAVFCFKNQENIYISNFEIEKNKYIKGELPIRTSGFPKSLIYLPIGVEDRRIGVLTVQSYQENAYTANDHNNLMSLASYLSIAFDNAIVYDIVRQKNDMINGSITYAQTIQASILPEQELHEVFDCFVFYQPKNVVSGDFYWMYKVSEKQSIVAVIDCTGHGVPGAFMSLVGFNLLNSIVIESKITEPDVILEELCQRIIKALRQDITHNHDGMDLIICNIEYIEEQPYLKYAAAKRPLILYAHKEAKIKTIAGTRRLIGGIGRQKEPFECHHLMLQKGDIVYLTTDGYSDQNSPTKTRMTLESLCEYFKEIATLPMKVQNEKLCQNFVSFRENIEQRDDVTIMGIKL